MATSSNPGFHGVRYQVKDVSRSVAFYTQHLGFKLEHQQLPAFASVSCGALQLLLSGPGASGSRQLPDGRRQEPGGWNRIVLRMADLPTRIGELKRAGVQFRNGWKRARQRAAAASPTWPERLGVWGAISGPPM